MHPTDCRCVKCLVDRSSLGTDEAKAARESVSDERAARVVARAKELDARTWPESAQPTPEQFADYLAAAPREKRIEIAETLLDAMDRADWCYERGHEQRPTTHSRHPWIAFPGKVPVCQDCGTDWQPVQRGECIHCGSDAGPLPTTPTTETRESAGESES